MSPFRELAQQLSRRAAAMLSSGEVSLVIGHRSGWRPAWSGPGFIASPQDADRLTAGPWCQTGLAKYLLTETKPEGPPVALFGRGCDILGARRLIVDRRLDPAQVRLVWLPCAGRVEPGRGTLARACRRCDVRLPSPSGVGAEVELLLPPDHPLATAIGAAPAAPGAGGGGAGEAAEPRAAAAERHEFWRGWFRQCLRCYACRAACPACHCRSCALESRDPRWVELSTGPGPQFMFQFLRGMDVAGRCVACGECERVCPAAIPLMDLRWAQVDEVGRRFGVSRPHLPRAGGPLGEFAPSDPDPDPGYRVSGR